MWGHVTPALRRPIEGPFILPDAVRTAELDAACRDRLATYPSLAPEQAVRLVRAAHLYAIALWDGEDDPPGAWLSLVGAIEAAVGTTTTPPEALLREAKPDLVAKLDAGGPGLVEAVAAEFGSHLQATKKFLDFTTRYMPGPPPKRPPEGFRLPWSKTELRKALNRVYKFRSIALHGGQPFPPPMCCVPDIVDDRRIPAEVPTGVATMTPTGTWRTEDTPMMLHTFAYIVRGALLAWWDEMARPDA